MAFVLKDRVRQSTDSVGTGDIVVSNSVSGYETFADALADGDTTLLLVRCGSGQWQTFLGTWREATQTIERTTIYDGSSGAGVAIDLPGGTQEVMITYPAQWYHTPTFQTLTVGAPSSSGRATFYGPLSGSNRALTVSQTIASSGSGAANVARFETSVSGTSTNQENNALYTFSGSDNSSAFGNFSIFSYTYGGATFQGGRNGQWVNVNSNADMTIFGDAFLVAHAPWWRAKHHHNGYPGAERGAIWGSNPLAWIGNDGTIGARRMRGVQGEEVNFGAMHHVFYRTGTRFVEWGSGSNNTGIGMWQDASVSFGRKTDNDLPGVRSVIVLGDSLGDWPITATGGTIMETQPPQIDSPSTYSAAIGFNLPDVTFDYGAMWFPGFFVDGDGNVGGRTVGGTTLQTVSAILAKSATVNSIAVVRGGLFLTMPTLTLSAPPSGGTTATAAVATMGIFWPFAMTGIYGSRGTGYVVGDVLTMSGGTFTTAGQYTVRAVDSTGQIIDMEPTTVGSYSVLPSNPVTLTGGTGTGATVAPYWEILTVSVTGAGTGYSEHAPPTVSVSGGSGVKFQAPLLVPVMSASQVQLQLNNGKINVTGIPTSSAGLSAGDVWSNAGVLTVV